MRARLGRHDTGVGRAVAMAVLIAAATGTARLATTRAPARATTGTAGAAPATAQAAGGAAAATGSAAGAGTGAGSSAEAEADCRRVQCVALTLDWRHRDSRKVARKALKSVRPGSVVLFHDIHPTTVDAMPRVLKGLAKRGYRFVIVSRLYGGRPPRVVYGR
ncbi:hypothetical protein [Nonomuraea composti]|uniref:hypothetical protein n=1 Tax=Nonomuraea composti TaxID=2720023 RepID=UPI00197EAC38|nr:hypothetical protein [Nonomuraea sp. FMUSA5-5]